MAFSSLTEVGRKKIAKLLFDNNEFYLAFGILPAEYVEGWGVDETVPSFVAKKTENELLTRGTGSVDFLANNDVHSILSVISDAVSSTAVLNGYINLVGVAGVQGNLQVVLVSGAFAGSETINFANGVLTISIQNGVTTRSQLATALQSHSLILTATVLSGGSTPVTLGVDSDNVFLVGGRDSIVYLENVDFKIGYVGNSDNLQLGSVNWLTSNKPSTGATYKASYWYKTLLSVQEALLNVYGFKKAVSKNYVVEDANGSIRANDKKWSVVSVPSKHIAMNFLIDNLDLPQGLVVRQYGLYTGVVPVDNSEPNNFFTVDELSSIGDLLVVENISPFAHETISSLSITIVLTM